jgi:hypothetical protein
MVLTCEVMDGPPDLSESWRDRRRWRIVPGRVLFVKNSRYLPRKP